MAGKKLLWLALPFITVSLGLLLVAGVSYADTKCGKRRCYYTITYPDGVVLDIGKAGGIAACRDKLGSCWHQHDRRCPYDGKHCDIIGPGFGPLSGGVCSNDCHPGVIGIDIPLRGGFYFIDDEKLMGPYTRRRCLGFVTRRIECFSPNASNTENN